ncbi:hypothetical protein KSC_024160 [Ktedonobacter sp. SOSP1-52]|uniref:acyl-homoserine-lactone synthase n=1 Tax=Ktedonobacter sp. SOSP1-52 TaxID=2778366 RepID=UPI0019166339|nr:acyl-homoserine-lactone synthase [Ktedonobacter sp. SOSP1-52]GHO63524.1 hypothetical protein KSC_024160 [Ktedonobacter sp. SOSP1-52]
MAIDQIASQITSNKEQHGESVSRIHRLRGQRYTVQKLGTVARQVAYQRLRYETFIERLGWDIPAKEGREYDHYDLQESAAIQLFGIFGKKSRTEYLLGGVRVFSLNSWDISMTMSEFKDAGMIPSPVLEKLASRSCTDLIEITRLCVKRGSRFLPSPSTLNGEEAEGFDLAIARDLTYAAVYKVAEETGRYHALALVHSSYLHLMTRGKFVFDVLHAENLRQRNGYALTLINLPATTRAIRANGERDRANRMLSLCRDKKAFETAI